MSVKAQAAPKAPSVTVLSPVGGSILQRKCICGTHTMGGGQCADCAKNKSGLQRKPAIGASNDPLEQEANRIADQMMAAPAHSQISGALPRGQHFAGQPTSQMDAVPASLDRVLGSSGRPFGHDFSRMRVHSDGTTEQSTREVGAVASVVRRSDWNRGLSRVSAPSAMTGAPGANSQETTAVMPGPAEDVVPTSGELPGAPSACVVQSAMPYGRSGIIRTLGSVRENFEVRIEWSSARPRGKASYCAAQCGEYHQFVKGYFKSSSNEDGSDLVDVPHKIFGGKLLDQNVFQEDGLDRNPKARYGHRNEVQTTSEKYEPDRATGTKYVGNDSPGVHIGRFADFDLTFVGKLVDTCNGTETVSDPWRVIYRGSHRP